MLNNFEYVKSLDFEGTVTFLTNMYLSGMYNAGKEFIGTKKMENEIKDILNDVTNNMKEFLRKGTLYEV